MPPAAKISAASRSLADWALSGIGLSAATASAGFAAYMIVLSPKEVASGNFRIFAQFDRRFQPPLDGPGATEPATGPTTGEPSTPSAAERTAEAPTVDRTPTGSIATAGRISQSGAPAALPGHGPYNPDGNRLPGYTLRDVFDGHALVETRSGITVVQPGVMLDGAGQVVSIERRGESWVVLTDKGLIAAGHL